MPRDRSTPLPIEPAPGEAPPSGDGPAGELWGRGSHQWCGREAAGLLGVQLCPAGAAVGHPAPLQALEYTRQHYNRHAGQYANTQEALQARAAGPGAPLKRFHNNIKRLLIQRCGAAAVVAAEVAVANCAAVLCWGAVAWQRRAGARRLIPAGLRAAFRGCWTSAAGEGATSGSGSMRTCSMSRASICQRGR